MIININNYIFSDNSQEVTKDIIFVSSSQNSKFLDDVQNKPHKNIITDKELKKYFDFSSIKIVGITGTNGKTTTAGAIYSFLLDLGYKVALQGTRGFFINDEKIKDYTLTTPTQLENFANISQAIENGCEFFIMEVSSHAIVQKRIEGLDFALKIHTNITRDHLDYHKTLEEYIKVKNSFFSDNSSKLINKDDKNVKYHINKGCFSYGLDNNATYKVQAFTFKDGFSTVALQHFGKLYHFTSSLVGTFNVYNLTSAVAATHILTHNSLDEICEVVDHFAGIAGRMEVVWDNPFIVVDFAHTPNGMEEVFKSFLDRDIIVVFGAGGNRDIEKRKFMGQIANEYAKYIIVTSDNPRFEDPDKIINDIVQGIYDTKKLQIEINRAKAIEKSIEIANKCQKSVILILGKGDEEYQIIYDKKVPFNDKAVVNKLLG